MDDMGKNEIKESLNGVTKKGIENMKFWSLSEELSVQSPGMRKNLTNRP